MPPKHPLELDPVATEAPRLDARAFASSTLLSSSIGPPPFPAMMSRPSIAVLPFQNLSDDAHQTYFADGMVDEVITALSRWKWLFVIARNSSFAYRGRAIDVKEIGSALGVHYILEGSVRRAGSRIRIVGELVDALTGINLWADRFEGDLVDVFDLQDQIASRVVGAIAPKLEQAEIFRVKRKPTENLDAYDTYLRGTASVYRWTREGIEEGSALFHKAIDQDPDYTRVPMELRPGATSGEWQTVGFLTEQLIPPR